MLSLALLVVSLSSGALAEVATFAYYRANNFDSSVAVASSPVCQDRCDVSGLCANKQLCAELTKKYSCSEYYAPGKTYAGWCDRTCGVCKKEEAASQQREVTPLETTASEGGVRRVGWDAKYRLFDSPKDISVSRFDFNGSTTDLRLGGSSAFLSLSEGAAYFFTTSPLLVIRDVTNAKAYSSYATEAAWASKGSCLQLDVGRNAAGGNVSVVVVSSGDVIFSTSKDACKPAVMRIGSEDLHNNPVDYVANGTCKDSLAGPGGASDYDDLDAPIGPLRAHYHTRGALYYNAAGTSKYDAGVPGITSGELRFVQVGFYYGPETMWDNAYVMSFHEPDPSARSTKPVTTPSGFQPCSFACCDDPSKSGSARGQMKCIAPAHNE